MQAVQTVKTNNFKEIMAEKLQNKRFRSRIIAILVVAVILLTAYIMMKPAITATDKTLEGIQEITLDQELGKAEVTFNADKGDLVQVINEEGVQVAAWHAKNTGKQSAWLDAGTYTVAKTANDNVQHRSESFVVKDTYNAKIDLADSQF